jgi:hypothetical protein
MRTEKCQIIHANNFASTEVSLKIFNLLISYGTFINLRHKPRANHVKHPGTEFVSHCVEITIIA